MSRQSNVIGVLATALAIAATATLAIALALRPPATAPASPANAEPRQPLPEPPAATVPPAPPAVATSPSPDAGSPRLKLLVPAYFYPAGADMEQWDRLIRAAAKAPVVIVVNPASGPGEKRDANYAAMISRAAREGATAIGYVDTRYAKRPTSDGQADIDRWTQFYPDIRGVFLDSQAPEPAHVEYYAGLRKHAELKITRPLVVTNPGTACAEEFFSRPVMDTACVFESPEGFDRFHLPAWSDRYPPASVAVLPYRIASAEGMRECIRRATRSRIGAIYVSDAAGPDPWTRLPLYWEAEVDAVHRVNQRQEP